MEGQEDVHLVFSTGCSVCHMAFSSRHGSQDTRDT